MQLRAFQQAEEAYHQSLINQAVANSEVDIPQEMVDQRIDEIEQEVKLNMEAQGMDLISIFQHGQVGGRIPPELQ